MVLGFLPAEAIHRIARDSRCPYVMVNLSHVNSQRLLSPARPFIIHAHAYSRFSGILPIYRMMKTQSRESIYQLPGSLSSCSCSLPEKWYIFDPFIFTFLYSVLLTYFPTKLRTYRTSSLKPIHSQPWTNHLPRGVRNTPPPTSFDLFL